jgi:hypothetical protein
MDMAMNRTTAARRLTATHRLYPGLVLIRHHHMVDFIRRQRGACAGRRRGLPASRLSRASVMRHGFDGAEGGIIAAAFAGACLIGIARSSRQQIEDSSCRLRIEQQFRVEMNQRHTGIDRADAVGGGEIPGPIGAAAGRRAGGYAEVAVLVALTTPSAVRSMKSWLTPAGRPSMTSCLSRNRSGME